MFLMFFAKFALVYLSVGGVVAIWMWRALVDAQVSDDQDADTQEVQESYDDALVHAGGNRQLLDTAFVLVIMLMWPEILLKAAIQHLLAYFKR